MRRLFLFLGSLSWGSRLQTLAVVLILGWNAWFDYQRGNWPVTIGIICFAWLLGWLLKPLMMAYPIQATKIWGTLGIAYFLTFFLARNQWWWRLMITHYASEFYLWLDLSCGYWFVSEMCLQQQRIESALTLDPTEDSQYDSEILDNDRHNDDRSDDRDRLRDSSWDRI